ncbi:hypothetical protein CIP107503_02272 [Corynebacterium diphtheriae]|nr:hypothetical protein CIP107503_02272 [Corynebacterium diphtheriae]CAB1050247.1 hypothetical protein NCTC10648_02352 [Corynebacterium diphtheriae]
MLQITLFTFILILLALKSDHFLPLLQLFFSPCFCPLASAASDVIPEDATSRVVVEPGESFTFTFDDETSNDGVFTRSVNAVACTGTFAAPQVEAGGIISYGLHVRCTGTGFLPLSAKI